MSLVIPTIVGGIAKAFLACSPVKIIGLPAFLKLLQERDSEIGLLTIANHISVVDEPFMWGKLPIRTFASPKTVRWTLGAADIMFITPFRRWFFGQGQIISTNRGAGVYQDAIDISTQKLNEGKWVHIFPEGMIKQENRSELRRFRWGVSKVLMDVERTPIIVPIWIAGFEKSMSESRTFPRFLPRLFKPITIIIGNPIQSELLPLLSQHQLKFPIPWKPKIYGRGITIDLAEEPISLAERRIEIAELLRRRVMELGEGETKEVKEKGEV